MTPAASVGGGEKLRVFCALRLPDEWLDELVEWQESLRTGARVVPRQNVHVTLAFLGHLHGAAVGLVVETLREAAAGATTPVLRVVRYRETRSVGMLVLEDEGGRATALADDLQRRLKRAGVYEPEARRWLPHLTVLRFRERPHLDPRLPSIGAVSPSEAAVYHSVLRPGGAQYAVLETVALGGS